MGQGYFLVNFSGEEHTSPHEWGSGLRLREFAFSLDTFAVLYRLLSTSWRKSRVALIGQEAFVDDEIGLVPGCDEFDRYRGLETTDLRKIEGLVLLRHVNTLVASKTSSEGKQIDMTSLPERVFFVNAAKKTYFAVSTKDIDECTVAALVWFIVDRSNDDVTDLIGVSTPDNVDDRFLEDEEVLSLHGGSWAYDEILAHDDPEWIWNEYYRDHSHRLKRVAKKIRLTEAST